MVATKLANGTSYWVEQLPNGQVVVRFTTAAGVDVYSYMAINEFGIDAIDNGTHGLDLKAVNHFLYGNAEDFPADPAGGASEARLLTVTRTEKTSAPAPHLATGNDILWQKYMKVGANALGGIYAVEDTFPDSEDQEAVCEWRDTVFVKDTPRNNIHLSQNGTAGATGSKFNGTML